MAASHQLVLGVLAGPVRVAPGLLPRHPDLHTWPPPLPPPPRGLGGLVPPSRWEALLLPLGSVRAAWCELSPFLEVESRIRVSVMVIEIVGSAGSPSRQRTPCAQPPGTLCQPRAGKRPRGVSPGPRGSRLLSAQLLGPSAEAAGPACWCVVRWGRAHSPTRLQGEPAWGYRQEGQAQGQGGHVLGFPQGGGCHDSGGGKSPGPAATGGPRLPAPSHPHVPLPALVMTLSNKDFP